MNKSQDFPFIEQIAERASGASCLAMIYQDQGKDITTEEVWKDIQAHTTDGVDYCSTAKMMHHAMANGFKIMIVRSHLPIRVLRICLQNQIYAILLQHQQKEGTEAFFTLLTGVEGETVLLNDPSYPEEEGKNKRISSLELKLLMKKNELEDELPNDNMLFLLLPEDQTQQYHTAPCPSCHFEIPYMNAVEFKISALGCPKCGHWILDKRSDEFDE